MAASPPAQVLLVGTFHFAPTDDATAVEFDVRSPKRQSELLGLIERLVPFRPAVVAVEAEPSQASRLDERFLAFRKGALEPSDNEIEQIAFPFAARCDLQQSNPRAGVIKDNELPIRLTHRAGCSVNRPVAGRNGTAPPPLSRPSAPPGERG